MLELRNVTKIYHSKSGNDVRALDNVSISFPETGMVFILGKSGSGKSTLLNVIGGLDSCDSGEFVIKGKSSRSFAGSDFDAYRNTFIGFIFQEYNILDDFTVGANIALALELQGKKATNEQINAILAQVGMLEYAKRKPNELSGGQKQRIAIARALVKDPEIIMADEPTGALDSNTGKQIFDTLKQLSKTKLVIIVSHDRDFAERYGDRIIEMMDGHIYTDVTKHEVQSVPVSSGILQMGENLLKIRQGYRLTPDDVELINRYLSTRQTDVIVSGDPRLNENVRNVAGISENNTTTTFNYTNPATDIPMRMYDGTQTRFIRSRLPIKNALKMGASGLKHKVFRLVVTIFLSLVAFTLFGFADTMASYDKITATTKSIIDTQIKNASFTLEVKEMMYQNGELKYTSYSSETFNDDDVSALSKRLGINFTPVFNGSNYVGQSIDLTDNMKSTTYIGSSYAYRGALYGFASISKAELEALGFTVTGNLPQNTDEIAISKFMYEQFKLSGYKYGSVEIPSNQLTMDETGSNSIIGKKLEMKVSNELYTKTVTAVIDTKFEYDRYDSYIPKSDSSSMNDGQDDGGVMDMVMMQELATTLQYSYHCLGFVTKDDISAMAQNMYINSSESSLLGYYMYWEATLKNNDNTIYIQRVGKSDLVPQLKNVSYFDKNKTSLGQDEILVNSSFIQYLNMPSINLYSAITAILNTNGYFDCSESSDFQYLLEYAVKHDYAKDIVENRNTSQAKLDVYNAAKTRCDEEAPSDEYMIGYIAEYLEYISGAPTAKELCGKAYKKIAKDVLKIDTTAYTMEDEIWDDIFSECFYVGFNDETSEKKIYTEFYYFQRIFAKLFACKAVYYDGMMSNESFVNSLSYKYDGNFSDLSYKEQCAYIAMSYSEQLYYDNSVLANAFAKYIDLSNGDISLDSFKLSVKYYQDGNELTRSFNNCKVVGIFESTSSTDGLLICDALYNAHIEYRDAVGYYYSEYADHTAGIYSFVIAPMPENESDIRKLVEIGYAEGDDIIFKMQNQVINSLEFFNEFIEMGAKIFVYVGLGFALFAALMMMNFISTSISYKRREIGILRAVGARSSDVFQIFFSEALIIALINYVLSVIATILSVTVLNIAVRNEGINVTLLSFGIRQIILMLLISVFVAALASFLPVWSIAKRKPVDAIKNT